MKYKGKKVTHHRYRQLKTAKVRRDEWLELNIYNYERILKKIEERHY